MFTALAIGSALVHIRTFFFMPYSTIPDDVSNYSLVKSSIMGRIIWKETIPERKTEVQEISKVSDTDSWTASLKSFLFWQYLVAFNILNFRVKTIQGWVYPWMDWTYSAVTDSAQSEVETYVSNILDFYGYLLYASPLFAALPSLIFKIISSSTGSKFKGDFWGLVIISTYSCLSLALNSFQMCYQ